MSRYKGGTLIAEDVQDLETHKKRVADPDGYRPEQCQRCLYGVLHVHDHLTRKPKDLLGIAEVAIIRYICDNVECRATWRILPAFLPRHLSRIWPKVEQTVDNHATKPGEARVPKRTAQRWRARLGSAAKQLVVLLARSGGAL